MTATSVEPTEGQLRDLEERADSIYKQLAKSTVSPIVVEFAGSPKSGKSTTIDILNHFFRRRKFKVWAPTEGASKRTPYHLKRDLVAFNTWTLNYAISELLVAYHNVDHHDLIMLDRGPFDSLAWMGVLKRLGNLENDEYEVFEAFALHKRWSTLISRLYLFKCQPGISLNRENSSKLTRGHGTAMNENMLNDLLFEYEAIVQKWGEEYPLQAVDTSESTTPLSTSFDLAQDIVKEFEKRFSQERV